MQVKTITRHAWEISYDNGVPLGYVRREFDGPRVRFIARIVDGANVLAEKACDTFEAAVAFASAQDFDGKHCETCGGPLDGGRCETCDAPLLTDDTKPEAPHARRELERD